MSRPRACGADAGGSVRPRIRAVAPARVRGRPRGGGRPRPSGTGRKRTMTYRLYELPLFPNAGGRKTETVEERSPLHNIRQPGSVDPLLARIHHSQNITHGSD